ncbi:HET-domain-containing protein [Acephala macrosclerotiorum]|nr:HET-domain-containing protein [Acephala macrosclerotiorum]
MAARSSQRAFIGPTKANSSSIRVPGPESFDESRGLGCKTCRYLFSRKTNGQDDARATVCALESGAKEGCHYCRILHEGIEALMPSSWSDWPTSKQEAVLRNRNGHFFLMKHPDGRESVWIEFFTSKEEVQGDLNFLPFLSQGWVADESDSVYCLEKLRSWWMECLRGGGRHEACRQSPDQQKLPRRIVEVLSETGAESLRLVETNGLQGRYNALSHCWGQSKEHSPLSTTGANISAHLSSLDWENFSKTFQDAVKITRYLNIQYLWIDSLCIIQDDEKDWFDQAPRMGSIYAGATLTIVATRATHGGMGCFSSRESVKSELMIGNTHVNIYARKSFFSNDEWSDRNRSRSDRNPLRQRGWCLQERLLSSRTVEYTESEMVWQCRGLSQCESQGIFEKDLGSSVSKLYEARKKQSGMWQVWRDIVTAYTLTKLTKESDLFPAISALAEACGRGRYLAGLWEEDLVPSLCWYSAGGGHLRPLSYTAPSFSWASRMGIVRWPYITVEEGRILVTVLKAQTETYREYRLGAVRDGFLELKGVLIAATMSVLLQYPREGGPKVREADSKLNEHVSVNWFAEDVQQDPNMYTQEVFFVPLLENDLLLDDFEDVPCVMEETKGLVLERTGKESMAYKRLGYAEMRIDGKWFQNQCQTTCRIV